MHNYWFLQEANMSTGCQIETKHGRCQLIGFEIDMEVDLVVALSRAIFTSRAGSNLINAKYILPFIPFQVEYICTT